MTNQLWKERILSNLRVSQKYDNERRFYIGKMGISVLPVPEVLNVICDQISKGSPAYICIANVHTTVLSQHDADFCRIQNGSLLTMPDGMPLVWCAWLAGVGRLERVTGIDLMLKILEVSPNMGYSHYFYGDTQQVLSEVTRSVCDRYPGVPILGVYSPPFRPLTDSETDRIISEINHLRPTFVWVALGGPKQERWMAQVVEKIDRSILVGVGAAFRALIGYYSRPSLMIQRCGLEGLFWRVRREPLATLFWYLRYSCAFAPLILRCSAKRFLKH